MAAAPSGYQGSWPTVHLSNTMGTAWFKHPRYAREAGGSCFGGKPEGVEVKGSGSKGVGSTMTR